MRIIMMPMMMMRMIVMMMIMMVMMVHLSVTTNNDSSPASARRVSGDVRGPREEGRVRRVLQRHQGHRRISARRQGQSVGCTIYYVDSFLRSTEYVSACP